MTHHLNKWPAPPRQAWLIVLIASLFFFYEFIQMNMMNAISQAVIHAFHVNAEQLGRMSAFYFIANVIFLFMAGSVLDRYSTRSVILVSLAICILGTAMYALANSFFWVIVCRFLTGVGSAFCFLSVLRLISRWFPVRKTAQATGVVVTIAMIGGVVAQTPFAYLADHVGWRYTLFIDAVFGVLVWIVIARFVQDHPSHLHAHQEQEKQQLRAIGYWPSFRLAFFRWQNWLGGFFTSTINLPINVLGGLWGVLYLTQVAHLSRMSAATVSSMLFVGTIFGSPVMGWLSDRLHRRKPVMIAGALCSLLLMVWLRGHSVQSAWVLCVIFFLIGFASSAQVIGYPLVAESNPRIVTAMAVSIVNITTIGGIGFIQWLYGYILELGVDHRTFHGVYSSHDFYRAMVLFVIGYIVSLCTALFIKETHCRHVEDDA